MMRICTAFLLLFIPGLISAVADTKCSFLSAEEGPPFSLDLPANVLLSHDQLPLEFRGISPIVTKASVPSGSMPKIIIQRYSVRPHVFFDDEQQRVVVASSTSCSNNNKSKNTAATSSGISSFQPHHHHFWTLASVAAFWLSSSPSWTMTTLVTGLLWQQQGVQAAEDTTDSCDPVVQVLVQAPVATYKGAVEVCREEINDPAICPDDFPTFDTACQQQNPAAPICPVVVVGAGAGGLYTALR